MKKTVKNFWLSSLIVIVCATSSFAGFEKVAAKLRSSGLNEMANLTVALDYTRSNETSGTRTFRTPHLHDLAAGDNPYQVTLKAVGDTLFQLDGDHRVTLIGFGDERTAAHSFFFLGDAPEASTFTNVEEALSAYQRYTPYIRKFGPTNFAPSIRYVIEQAKRTGQMQILVIVTDGEVEGRFPTSTGGWVNCEEDTRAAIREASAYPISIIGVGVGDGRDGRFGDLEEYDDKIKGRNFDNFNFVKFNKFWESHVFGPKTFDEVDFATEAVKELPKQFKEMKKLRYL